MKILRLSGLILFAATAGGCSDGPADRAAGEVDTIAAAIQQRNAQELNGARINGARINGARINGIQAGATFTIDSVPGPLRVIRTDTGRRITGDGLVGAQFWVSSSPEVLARVVVTGYQRIAGLKGNLDAYVIAAADTGQSICGYDGSGAAVPAVPIDYVFDPITGDEISDSEHFTFACRGGAIEKCLEWGYPKWETAPETFGGVTQTRSLSSYHAACVHMVRADYCGDGVPHTFTGTVIDVLDNLGIEVQTTSAGRSGWYQEAEWDSSGAWCINNTRWMPRQLGGTLAANQSSQNPDWAYVQQNCPWRIAGNPWPGNPDGTGAPHPCVDDSSYYPRNAFTWPDQSVRSGLRNHTMLYQFDSK